MTTGAGNTIVAVWAQTCRRLVYWRERQLVMADGTTEKARAIKVNEAFITKQPTNLMRAGAVAHGNIEPDAPPDLAEKSLRRNLPGLERPRVTFRYTATGRWLDYGRPAGSCQRVAAHTCGSVMRRRMATHT